MKTNGKKVPISERALTQRINRKLQQQNNPEKLIAARGTTAREQLGHYYTVETNTSAVARSHVDLEKLASKLGVIQPWEEMRAE